MVYTTLLTEQQDNTYTVSLNRPDVHNAMNETMMRELTKCFQEASKDPNTRIIIFTGKGKSFCAGADLHWMKSMVNYSREENIQDSKLLLDLYETIYHCPKPVIGRINGHAFGGGIGLIAVCDIAIGIPESLFAFSEVTLGIIPSIISTYIRPRVKLSDMRRFFITGERFNASVAQQIGLLDLIVSAEEIDNKISFYQKILQKAGPNAIKEVKHLLFNLQTMDITKYKQHTLEKIAELRVSDEGQEGINAFLEKRKSKWRE